MNTDTKIPDRVLRAAWRAGRAEVVFQEDGYRPGPTRMSSGQVHGMRAVAKVIVEYLAKKPPVR